METKDRKTKYRPQLSIIICGSVISLAHFSSSELGFIRRKRHHARYVQQGHSILTKLTQSHRFFPTNGPQADKNGNTRPGTVVDKGVTGV